MDHVNQARVGVKVDAVNSFSKVEIESVEISFEHKKTLEEACLYIE